MNSEDMDKITIKILRGQVHRLTNALAILPEEIGKINHEVWVSKMVKQQFHHPKACPYMNVGGKCGRCHEDIIEWECLPEPQKEMNRTMFKHILDEMRRRAGVQHGEIIKEKLAGMGELRFTDMWSFLEKEIHKIAMEKGWWNEPRNQGQTIALIHAELSECLEALREGNPPDKHLPEFNSAEVELADVVIRLMDMAYFNEWKVGEAVIAKMKFNFSRDFLHGGKKF